MGACGIGKILYCVLGEQGPVTLPCLSPSEIDRCASARDTCGPGTCVNLPGRYTCVCGLGYRLHPSLPQCIGMSLALLFLKEASGETMGVRNPASGNRQCGEKLGSADPG